MLSKTRRRNLAPNKYESENMSAVANAILWNQLCEFRERFIEVTILYKNNMLAKRMNTNPTHSEFKNNQH